MLNEGIAVEVGLDRKQVGLWRRRWQQSFDALVAIECRESRAALRRAIEEVLADAPRAGSPGTFTAEQVTQILALACEPPEQSGRPITTWTHRELADEAVKRNIVPSISASQVGRYLAEAALQPHRSKYWLNTTEKDPELFEQQVQTVCQTYQNAPALYSQDGTITVCVDEMPGLQAVERTAVTKPAQPGANRIRIRAAWHAVPDRQLECSDGPTDRLDDSRNADRGGLCLSHLLDGTDLTARGLGFRRRQPERALQRSLGALRGACGASGLVDAGSQGPLGHPQVDGDTASLPLGSFPSHPLRVPDETQLMAEPN